MGTFIVRPTALVSGGTPLIDDGGPFPPVTEAYLNEGSISILDAFNGASAVLQSVAIGDGISLPASFDDTCRFSFSGACIYLDGSLVPIAAGSLPVGFTALSAAVVISEATPVTSGGPGAVANYYLQLDAGNDGVANIPTHAYGVIPPLFSTVLSNGIGVRSQLACDFANNSAIQFYTPFPVFGPTDLHLEGTYSTIVVPAFWYFNPLTNHYVYESVDPGNPWIRADPSLGVTSAQRRLGLYGPMGPASGPPSTVVQVLGTGFGDGATCPLGLVVVVNSHIALVVIEACSGVMDIVITNPDGTTATLVNGYTCAALVGTALLFESDYLTPTGVSGWALQQFDVWPRVEETS